MSGRTSASPVASQPAGSSLLLHPVEAVTSAVRHAPGASAVKGAFDGVLDTVGVASPHTRRVLAYAGVGLLGAVGVVEWPVAAAGAAVVWLTQPLRPGQGEASAKAGAPRASSGRSEPVPPSTATARKPTSAAGTSKANAARATTPKAATARATPAKPSAAKGSKATAGATSARRRPTTRPRSAPAPTPSSGGREA
ncbi:hypothetical protein ABIA32_006226 [Streptacidiphilus sp. MAP12-20]